MVIAFIGTTSLSPIAFIVNVARKLYRNDDLEDYFKTIALSFDQAGGSIIYGQENFTISSYTYYLCKSKNNKYACSFMKMIDAVFGKNHCKESYYNEIRRDQKDIYEIKELI